MEEIAIGEFLWGVATSAYQSEGGYNGAGEPQTNWAEAERCGDVKGPRWKSQLLPYVLFDGV